MPNKQQHHSFFLLAAIFLSVGCIDETNDKVAINADAIYMNGDGDNEPMNDEVCEGDEEAYKGFNDCLGDVDDDLNACISACNQIKDECAKESCITNCQSKQYERYDTCLEKWPKCYNDGFCFEEFSSCFKDVSVCFKIAWGDGCNVKWIDVCDTILSDCISTIALPCN